MLAILRRLIFGETSLDLISRYSTTVNKINQIESTYEKFSDEELKNETQNLKNRLTMGATLEEILPEAFAIVREASKRILQMRHFDVQLIGGICLHEGKIAEMKTGEGKTLVATLPAYLNALTGSPVYIVTVNDYLAKRDSEWMGKIFRFLGLKVGLIQSDMPLEDKKEEYQSDIIYGTNNEFGFDYLRDNMATELEQCVQNELFYAIIDEVDSILIDEARTPLIISGVVEEDTSKYKIINELAKKLFKEQHFTIEEKNKNIILTEEGISQAEKILGIEYLYDVENMDKAHMLVQSLKAQHLFKKDVDYVVKNNEVLIVDEFTGRLMTGRRYSDGLHQAIEAAENLNVQQESQTLASITFQNYFRLFKKLAGMTGTAMTEATEFEKIYSLETLEIPTNREMIRIDAPDAIYKTKEGKYRAIVKEIINIHKEGKPVLVGTIAIETSELLSKMLSAKKIPHNVLNAKYHEKEAEIIAKAGQPGQVTIATNMAGRGTDIVLGEHIADKGGLTVLGTERHESRRIDNQLRGRCGRQGDPGRTKFFVCLEDDLMRLFGSEKIIGIMSTLGFDEDTPIEAKMITKSLERAQKKVEIYHFNIRKQLLEYDDVMNQQREIVYKQRKLILAKTQLEQKIEEIIQYHINRLFQTYAPEHLKIKDINFDTLKNELSLIIPADWHNLEQIEKQHLKSEAEKKAINFFKSFITKVDKNGFISVSKLIYLHNLDLRWIEHLKNMDHLRDGIGLRAYAQKDPLLEYKREAFEMFQIMMDNVELEVIKTIFRIQIVEELPKIEEKDIKFRGISYQHKTKLSPNTSGKNTKKAGRNTPCPCGSGKKYKVCCGKQF